MDRARMRVRQTRATAGQEWVAPCRSESDTQSATAATVGRRPDKKSVCLFLKFSQQFGTKELLMNLALCRVDSMPFPASRTGVSRFRR